jgi:hypothetical protein
MLNQEAFVMTSYNALAASTFLPWWLGLGTSFKACRSLVSELFGFLHMLQNPYLMPISSHGAFFLLVLGLPTFSFLQGAQRSSNGLPISHS